MPRRVSDLCQNLAGLSKRMQVYMKAHREVLFPHPPWPRTSPMAKATFSFRKVNTWGPPTGGIFACSCGYFFSCSFRNHPLLRLLCFPFFPVENRKETQFFAKCRTCRPPIFRLGTLFRWAFAGKGKETDAKPRVPLARSHLRCGDAQSLCRKGEASRNRLRAALGFLAGETPLQMPGVRHQFV